jgi:fatty acid desaturase
VSSEIETWVPSRIEGLSKFSTKNSSYGDFRRNLRPQYFKNSLPVFSSHLYLIFCVILISNFNSFGNLQILMLATLSLVGGLLAHRILLLVHEGAHFHLAKNRKFNDFLANTFCGVFVGTEVKTYRKIHNKHHQDLGLPTDPENSYAEEFDFTWIFAAFSGLKVLRTFKKRESLDSSKRQLIMMLLSVTIHVTFVLGMLQLELSSVAIFWILSFFVVMPGIAALRNVLEHRFEMPSVANPQLWGTLSPEMRVTTRLFTKKRISMFFGSVGFDRHLLHHWDPSIAAINLPAVHQFVLTTELREMLESLPTTYTAAFLQLMRKNA